MLFQLNELEDRGVYELSLGEYDCVHWKETSVYIQWEDFWVLSPYIDTVIPNFNYYGPNVISFIQWKRIKEKILAVPELEKVKNANLIKLYNEIDGWVQECSKTYSCFSILGP